MDVPILCEVCLGPNPYVEMLKSVNNKACEVCERGFTVFRWKPGKDARYKKTVICKTCAKAKNVCQCCLFDMKYGLPVQVRDSVLESHEKVEMPSDSKGRRVMLARLEAKLDDEGGALPQYEQTNPLLEQIARNRGKTNYNRNRARICTFYVTGRCTRGDTCPYRHEMPSEHELQTRTSIKDRYLGNKDPLADRILSRAAGLGSGKSAKLEPPADQTITTLFVANIPGHATESDVRGAFTPFGVLTKLKLVPEKSCAFVTFQRRAAAEEAAMALNGNLVIAGVSCRLAWGKRATDAASGSGSSTKSSETGAAAAASSSTSGAALFPAVPPPPGMGEVSYPSMSSSFIPVNVPSKPPGM